MSDVASMSELESDPKRDAKLRERLLAWYARHRRPLPWRETSDPYAIWVSEAMLQQTRVETVEPYWRRFLERFPTLGDLAAAETDDVLALWSGLGYYRRARSLQEAARAIVERFDGRFPTDRDSVRSLPGIGPYTAGAVLSIAFDLPEPVVDGNVARVFARLFLLEHEVSSGTMRRELWELAERLVPRSGDAGGAGDWNQALMELGATICVPREPRCLTCPVRTSCRAFAAGRVAELPRKKAPRPPVDVELRTFVVRDGGRVLMERRPPDGRMAGMWQLPTIEVPGTDGALHDLFPAQLAPSGESIEAGELLGEIRHGITHHRIRVRVHRGHRTPGALAETMRWVRESEIDGLARTGMTKKILRARFVRSD